MSTSVTSAATQNEPSFDTTKMISIGNFALIVCLCLSAVGAMVYPIFWVLSAVLLIRLLASMIPKSDESLSLTANQSVDDTSRAGTIYFLAMEALDGVAVQTIYSDKLLQYDIQESEILEQKTRLVAAQREAWTDVKNFALLAFDRLDRDKDGFISKSELISGRSQSNPKLREHALLSFLINNIGDILAIVKSAEDADKGVRRQDLFEYFLLLENAAPKQTLSLPHLDK